MATRSTIIISNCNVNKNIANAKKTTKLLKCLGEKDDVGYIFKMYNSGNFEEIKEIVNDINFKYYWQYGNVQDLTSIFFVLLTHNQNAKPIDGYNKELTHYLHRCFITDNYFIDSEYIFWIDWYGKKLRIYETRWTDVLGGEDWDIKSLKLLECVDIPTEQIELYVFEDDD